MLYFRDLDELTTKDEIEGALRNYVTEEEMNEIKITSITEAFVFFCIYKGGNHTGPKTPNAKKITNKKTIKVGLVSCRIRERIEAGAQNAGKLDTRNGSVKVQRSR